MVEVSLTVGKLDASLALLLTRDHHLIEFPTILLPDGISAGSIVKITCDRDLEREKKEQEEFEAVQNVILSSFGLNSPKAPVLKTKNITQTSCVLEWDPLELGTASIKSLTLYRNKSRLGQIPNPLSNTTSKLSGLSIEGAYTFQLRLDTTAGVYNSNELNITTHKMTDLSGITVCLGEINFAGAPFTENDIEESLRKMGAKDLQRQVSVDTTHFVCTEPSGAQWELALKHNIPVVRPEWIKACELERRIIGVRMFYLDADPSYLRQRDFWKHSTVENDRVGATGSLDENSRPDGSAASVQESHVPEDVNGDVGEEVVRNVDQEGDELEAAAPAAMEESVPEEPVTQESVEVAPVVGEGGFASEERTEDATQENASHEDVSQEDVPKDFTESGEIEISPQEEAAQENEASQESPAGLSENVANEEKGEADASLEETTENEVSLEATVDEVPLKEAPLEEAPLEEALSEEAPLEEALSEEAPLEEVPLEETPLEEGPLEEGPLEDIRLEEAPLDEVVLKETSLNAPESLSPDPPAQENLDEQEQNADLSTPRLEPDEEESKPLDYELSTVSQAPQNNKSKNKNKNKKKQQKK